jgi:hypothetical protein
MIGDGTNTGNESKRTAHIRRVPGHMHFSLEVVEE